MRTGLGVVLAGDVGFVLTRDPDTVRAPDIAVLLKSRHPDAGTAVGFHDGPPDLAVEVLSPGDNPRRVQAKVDDYRRAGVCAVWVVDPAACKIRALRAPGTDEILASGDLLTAPDLLPGFSVPVENVFPP